MAYGKELIAELEGDIKRTQEAIARRQEHIDNCDFDWDDCFVSQHFDDRAISVANQKINLLKNGGYDWFTEYQTLDGVLVDATWCNTKYGYKLRVKMPDGTIKWTTAETKKGLEKIGLRKVMCKRSAWFCFRSSGSGLAGAYCGSYVTFPSDTNYWTGEPAESEPVEIRDYFEEE